MSCEQPAVDRSQLTARRSHRELPFIHHSTPDRNVRATSTVLRDNRRSSSLKGFIMRVRNLLLVLACLSLCSLASNADILKIVVNDTIQAASAERIERALDQAAAQKAEAVLIELSTPGGVMSDIMPKYRMKRCAASGGTPTLTSAGATREGGAFKAPRKRAGHLPRAEGARRCLD